MVKQRIFVILVVMAVGGYFAYDYFQSKALEKTTKEAAHKARKEKRELRHAAVAQMVSKYNAVNDWEDILRKGTPARNKKILTMELENLWLINKPILFKGRIKDISIFDDRNYLMTLDSSRFSTKLALNLKCPKKMIDSFLEANPKASSGTVAIIARVSKIESGIRKTEEGDVEEIKTGVGQCMDILLYNDFFLEDLLEERANEK